MHRMLRSLVLRSLGTLAVALAPLPPGAFAAPEVIVISLDGAKPDLVELYLLTGVLPRQTGSAGACSRT